MNASPKQEGLAALWYHFPSEAKVHRLISLSAVSNNNVGTDLQVCPKHDEGSIHPLRG